MYFRMRCYQCGKKKILIYKLRELLYFRTGLRYKSENPSSKFEVIETREPLIGK